MDAREIVFKGTTLEVEGHYYKGRFGIYEDPPEQPEFEIFKITVDGVEVTELLEDYLEEIELKVLEDW